MRLLIFVGVCVVAGAVNAFAATHYIAASGSDSNTGTTTGAPWLNAPGMPNCANTCAGYTPAAGDQIVFRGGDTWHFGNAAASPYTGGTWTWSWSGTAGNHIYIGVDQTWFTGGTWTRPILTGDNAVTTSTTLSGCTYQVGANNQLIWTASVVGVTFDNFEMLGMCQAATNPFGSDSFIVDSGATNVLFSNLYIHGWSHKQFSCSGGVGMCFAANIFTGTQGGTKMVGMQYQYLVVDGSDSDPTGWATFYDGAYDVSYSVFRYSAQIITQLTHLFHDNLIEYWYAAGDGDAHSNVLEGVSEPDGTNAIYNNVIRHLSPDGNTQVLYWPIPCASNGVPTATCTASGTDYVFNNVIYDVGTAGNGNYFNIGQNGSDQGTLVIFNNTFEQSQASPVLECTSVSSHVFTESNNYFISDTSPYYTSPCTNRTTQTAVQQTHATASGQGFNSSQSFAYSPTSPTNTVVGAGTNLQSANCTALTAAGLTAAGTACQSDTTYACSYNSGNHTVTCPARSAIARPASAAWDIGAYQFQIAPVGGVDRFRIIRREEDQK